MGKTIFICQNCGSQLHKWQGRCPDCDSWNSITEERLNIPILSGEIRGIKLKEVKLNSKPVLLSEIVLLEENRVSSIGEFDRVLGGGLVKGGVILVGGAPGIGKSTLLLQVSACIADKVGKVFYVSGEESLSQAKLRATRLGIQSKNLYLHYETKIEDIFSFAQELNPALLVIDSIQTMFTESVSSAPGSVGQVRECAAILIYFAKSTGIPLIIVGHITKDGTLAGPRVLEHMVDTVLYFDGESHANHRLIRAIKNRFGGTHEVGIFAMEGRGLVEIKNPSEFFLSERGKEGTGSAVLPVLEGYRPLLVEVQALVSRSYTAIPRRTVTGLDVNRVNILLAVLEKRCGLPLGQSDVFMNVVGAMKIKEPAADLAISLALASSFFESSLPYDTLFAGEVGLGGEIRGVSSLETRLREGKGLGFTSAIIPETQVSSVKDIGMKITGVENLNQALSAVGMGSKT